MASKEMADQATIPHLPILFQGYFGYSPQLFPANQGLFHKDLYQLNYYPDLLYSALAQDLNPLPILVAWDQDVYQLARLSHSELSSQLTNLILAYGLVESLLARSLHLDLLWECLVETPTFDLPPNPKDLPLANLKLVPADLLKTIQFQLRLNRAEPALIKALYFIERKPSSLNSVKSVLLRVLNYSPQYLTNKLTKLLPRLMGRATETESEPRLNQDLAHSKPDPKWSDSAELLKLAKAGYDDLIMDRPSTIYEEAAYAFFQVLEGLDKGLLRIN